MNWLRHRRPSPALVISLIALFVALGGTGYAAFTLPKNSVGTKQLKKNAVTTAKIKNNAVTGSKVKDGSLTGADVNLGTLGTVPNATHASSADNATNATNATTAANANQLGGKAPSAYISNIVIRRKDVAPLTNGGTTGGGFGGSADDGTVSCQAGERVLGGGVRIAAAGTDQAVSSSRPVVGDTGVPADSSTDATGWRGVASDDGSVAGDNPSNVEVFVICAS